MVVDKTLSDDDVDRLFRALADATRRDIVRRTLVGEASVSVLAADYDMSFAAVQKHVAVLEEAGLVTKQPRGRERIVRGNPDQIARARAAPRAVRRAVALADQPARRPARPAEFDRHDPDLRIADPNSTDPNSTDPNSTDPIPTDPNSTDPIPTDPKPDHPTPKE